MSYAPERHRLLTNERKALGVRLAKARKRKGLTRAQVAIATGLSHRHVIGFYERGDRIPCVQVFAALCRLYGVGMDDVYHGITKEK